MISLSRHSEWLSLHLLYAGSFRQEVRLMNERRSLHDSQHKVVCRNFHGLWRLKHKKTRIADRQWGSNFLRRGKNQYNIQKEKPKVMYSVALVLAFFATENENRQLEDSLPAHFSHISESILLSVRTKSITENFVNWKLRPLLFL